MKSAMRAASQLPGRGPWMLPLYLYVNKKSDDDDDDDDTHQRLRSQTEKFVSEFCAKFFCL